MLSGGSLRPLPLAAAAALALAGCGGAEAERSPGDGAPLVGHARAPPGRVRSGSSPATWPGARTALEADLSADPDQLSALNDLGVSYLLEGHAEAARRLLDEVVAKGGPREQQAALLNLGELYALEGYLDAAQRLPRDRRARWTRPAPSPGTRWRSCPTPAATRGGARTPCATALRLDEGGAARAGFAFAFPEERVHLEALLAEQAGDRAAAAARLARAGPGTLRAAGRRRRSATWRAS